MANGNEGKTLRLDISKLREKMILSEDVLTAWGSVLIPAGTRINKIHYLRMKSSDIDSASVYESSTSAGALFEAPKKDAMPAMHIVKVEDTPDFRAFSRTYKEKTAEVKHALIDIGNGSEINMQKLFDITNGIMSKLKVKSDLFTYLSSLRHAEGHIYSHSNNVSLLCNLFASWLGLNEEDTLNLTTAGLLHDIGKTQIDPSILNKPGRLTDDEFEMIKAHTVLGYNLLKNRDIPEEVKLAALMHHEKIDGSGYPSGLKGDEIGRLAKMLTICDIYDAMTANRAYRRKIGPFTVIKTFEQQSYNQLDTAYLLTFLENIAYTYMNSFVELTDGREGQVVFINKGDLSRPMVRVGNDVIDLKNEQSTQILSIL